MKCVSCGADVAAGSVVCEFCGSHLPAPADDAAAQFARIKASREYAERESAARHARLPKHTALQKAFLFGFLAIFIGGSLFIAVMTLGMAGLFGVFGFRAGRMGGALSLFPLCMSVVPLGLAAFGVAAFVALYKKMSRLQSAPVESPAVLVIDKRTQVSGGGDSSAQTSYYVTVQLEDGSRQEVQVWDGRLYGRMAAGDGGILYLRAGHGLDFDRVPD